MRKRGWMCVTLSAVLCVALSVPAAALENMPGGGCLPGPADDDRDGSVDEDWLDGRDGSGTLPWDLVSRNGQDVTSGFCLFAVEPEDGDFPRTIGKFAVIR